MWNLVNKLIVVLIVILFSLQYKLWFGDGSLSEIFRLSTELDLQQKRLLHLEQRNQKLEAQVLDLQQGLNVYEEKARHDLGMIKKGESFYQFIPAPESVR